MKKAKCLVIAPYEGLKEIFLSLAGDYSDEIDLDIHVGNLDRGLEIVQSMKNRDYDVIISRGGTASLIRNMTDYLVVDVGLSGFDYMRTLKMIESIKGKKALVGYKSVTENAISVNMILNADIDIFTLNSDKDLDPLLIKLQDEDYELIIGDTVTVNHAKELTINNLLLISGEESVRKAIQDAIILAERLKDSLYRLSLLEKLHNRKAQQTIFISNQDDEINVFPKGTKLLIELNTIKENLSSEDKEILIENNGWWISTVYRHLDSNTVAVSMKKMWNHNFFTPGIEITNYNSLSNQKLKTLKAYHSDQLVNQVRPLAGTMKSVLFIGDTGVGKTQLANSIHQASKHHLYPFITIDCSKAKIEDVERFINAYKSRKGTLFFRNIETLDSSGQLSLIEIISHLDRDHFKIMGAAHSVINNYLNDNVFDARLYKLFADTVIYVPNIKESHKELKDIIKYYLLKSNEALGKQVTGISNEAIELLEKHNWIYNFDQLEQVINQLVLTANSLEINSSMVKEVLKPLETETNNINLFNGSLDEIEKRVIDEVIKQEGGNVTKAAERLKISRSTIWRKFKI